MAVLERKDLTTLVDYLPVQYDNSPNLRKLLSIYLEEADELDQAVHDLYTQSTDIEVAIGYQLEIIGKLVGAFRQGRSDEEFRKEIYFRIAVNSGNGTPEDVIQYLKYVTKATKIGYWEHHPASVILETDGTTIPDNLVASLDRTTLAGVDVGGVIHTGNNVIFRGVRLKDTKINKQKGVLLYSQNTVGTAEVGNSEVIPFYNDVYHKLPEGSSLLAGVLPRLDSSGTPLAGDTSGQFARITTDDNSDYA